MLQIIIVHDKNSLHIEEVKDLDKMQSLATFDTNGPLVILSSIFIFSFFRNCSLNSEEHYNKFPKNHASGVKIKNKIKGNN